MNDATREARIGRWALAVVLVWLATVSEVVLRRGAAYTLADLVWSRWALSLFFATGAAAGGAAAARGHATPPWRASGWLVALGWTVCTASFGVFVAFGDHTWARVALPIAAVALGTATAGAGVAVVRLLRGLLPLRPGFVQTMSPLPVALVVVALLAFVALVERGGPLRAGAGLGLALVALGGHGAQLLAGSAPGAKRMIGLSLLSTITLAPLLALAEAFTPMAEAAAWPEAPAFAATGSAARLVVTSGRGAYQAYVDGALRFSSLDAYRKREAQAHPAMLAAARRRAVLILGGGDGGAAREVLRWPDVARVVVVEPDEVVLDAGLRQPVFLRENAGALGDAKVTVVRRDLFAYLATSDETFDVVLLDAADPDTPARSKMTTRAAFVRIARRLAEDGVGAVALASPLTQRGAFSSALAALRSGGLSALPYHAEVPTLGLRGYALFGRRPIFAPRGRLPGGLSWLDGPTLLAAFRLPADERPDPTAPPNLLHAQVGPAEGRRP